LVAFLPEILVGAKEMAVKIAVGFDDHGRGVPVVPLNIQGSRT